jgi:hypothetical protein
MVCSNSIIAKTLVYTVQVSRLILIECEIEANRSAFLFKNNYYKFYLKILAIWAAGASASIIKTST